MDFYLQLSLILCAATALACWCGWGLARLALETGVPVIPVAMIGTDSVNPPGSKMWRFGRVTVKFGKPMDFSRMDEPAVTSWHNFMAALKEHPEVFEPRQAETC